MIQFFKFFLLYYYLHCNFLGSFDMLSLHWWKLSLLTMHHDEREIINSCDAINNFCNFTEIEKRIFKAIQNMNKRVTKFSANGWFDIDATLLLGLYNYLQFYTIVILQSYLLWNNYTFFIVLEILIQSKMYWSYNYNPQIWIILFNCVGKSTLSFKCSCTGFFSHVPAQGPNVHLPPSLKRKQPHKPVFTLTLFCHFHFLSNLNSAMKERDKTGYS